MALLTCRERERERERAKGKEKNKKNIEISLQLAVCAPERRLLVGGLSRKTTTINRA